MPRAATALLAIACSAQALGPDVSWPTLGCEAKRKRGRLVPSKRVLELNSEVSLEPTADDEEGLLQIAGRETQTITNVGERNVHVSDEHWIPTNAQVVDTKCLCDDMVLSVLKYSGVSGRTVSRASQRVCDVPLQESLHMPTFPLHVSMIERYNFGPHQVTSNRSITIAAPETSAVLEVSTEADGDDPDSAIVHTMLKGPAVLSICRELRTLQSKLGAQYRANVPWHIELKVVDSANRILLDHAHVRHGLQSEVDDLLELLTEPDAPHVTPSVNARCSDLEAVELALEAIGNRGSSRTPGGPVSQPRPASRHGRR